MLTLEAIRKNTSSGDRVELFLSGPAAPPQLQAGPIFFELDGVNATDLSVLDGFVGSIVHCAMAAREPLHVRGRLTRTCLRQLSQYQRFWSLIRPDRYAPVAITADEVVADRGDTRDLPAVAAYSGGVDSSFSVVRNKLKLKGMDSIPLEAVLTVHGFDVLLSDTAGFARRLDRLQPVIEELGLRRYVVRTNIKELILQDWLDAYAAQLAACLHMVCHRHSKALIASDGYAHCPDFEFAGNPITVPLLSTARLKVLYEGAEYGRTDKVALLAQYPTVRRSLKFCWEGPDADRNCGKCRGCILTYMNFRAVGIDNPECFDTPVDESIVGNFPTKHLAGLALRYELLEHLWRVPQLADLTARFAEPIMRFEQEEAQRRSPATEPKGTAQDVLSSEMPVPANARDRPYPYPDVPIADHSMNRTPGYLWKLKSYMARFLK
jgi:hypothetical protein